MNVASLVPHRVLKKGCLESRRLYLWSLALGLAGPVALPVSHAAEVLTQHNDNWRTGSNLNEVVLTPSSVSTSNFGKLFSYVVDGQVYAQPLVVDNLFVAGAAQSVVYVATMEDSVYAFDATKNVKYWQVSFVGGAITPVPVADITHDDYLNIHGHVGILSTPVIDRASSTLYVLARTKNTFNSSYHQHLHALDLATGAEKFGGPVEISSPGFDPKLQSQRPALGLANGNVYIAWASHEDIGPYHGYVMGYNATTLKQSAVMNTTPSGSMGGIWQAGQGPAFDRSGNLYFMSGNGDWNGTTNFGSSFIKLTPTLAVMDWFTPADFMDENAVDADLGSSGVLILPAVTGYPTTTYIVGGGKQGRLFVLDKNNQMGRYTAGDVGAHQVFQATQTTSCSHHIHGSPVYWKSRTQGEMVYLWGENDVGKAFKFNGSTLTTSPFSVTTARSPMAGCGMPGSSLSISANGDTGGILWANCVVSGDAAHGMVPGVLRAYDANNLSVELWNSLMNPTQNNVGNLAKFVSPTIANGRVYLASFSNEVHVFGLGARVDTGPVNNNQIYRLVNRGNKGVLDNFGGTVEGAPVGQGLSSSSTNQQWLVTNISGSTYKLSCISGGRFLDSLGNTTDGSAIGQKANSASSNQQWIITFVGWDIFRLTNVSTGKFLDNGGHPLDGAPMELWYDNASFNQQWQFVPL